MVNVLSYTGVREAKKRGDETPDIPLPFPKPLRVTKHPICLTCKEEVETYVLHMQYEACTMLLPLNKGTCFQDCEHDDCDIHPKTVKFAIL